MDCKEKGISDASGCDSSSVDKSTNSLSSNLQIDINDKSSSGGHNIDSVRGLAIPQIASVVNSTMKDQRKCTLEFEQMVDGDSNSKEDAGNSDFGLLAVSCNADDTWNQEVVSDELEQIQDSIADDVLLVNCNNQNNGKESQDTNLSHVSTVLESMQEKEALQAKEDEGCGGTILPIGGYATNIESTFVSDAPEQFESLETAKHRESVGVDGNSSTFDGGVQEGRNEPYQDAGSAADISFIHSSCPFPDSILDSGVFSCIATENYLKDSGEIEGNVPIVASPSLAITEMLSNNGGGICSYDLDDIIDTETISPDLKLVLENELRTDHFEKNEKTIRNDVGDSPSESTVVSVSMNNEMGSDLRGESVSQISPIYERIVATEANSLITYSSLIRNFPLNFGKQVSKFCSPDNAVEPLRIVNGNGRIGGEVASASGTTFCETGLSSSGRRARGGKQCKTAPHPRKSSKKKQSERKIETIFKFSKRKRSSVPKPNCSSEWGLPSRIIEIFSQSNNISHEGPPRHKTQKSLSNPKNGGHSSSHNGYVEGSTKNIQPSSGSCLRLKVKFGKSGSQTPLLNITVSQVSDNSSPSNGIFKAGTGLELPGSENVIDGKLQTMETREHLEENSHPVENCSDRQSSDSIKDENNNQDAGGLCKKLGGDVLDDTHFSSSRMVEECERAIGTRSLGAETSPDSEVINSVPDSIVGIEHKGDLRHSFFTREDVVNKNRVLEKEDELLASGSPLENGLHLVPSAKKGKHSKSKGNGTKKGKSKFSESAKDRRKNESQKGAEQRKSTHRSIGRDDSDYYEVGTIEPRETIGALLDPNIGKTNVTNSITSSSVTHGEMVLHGTIDNSSSTESAWVNCDVCSKWRRIPASVVESIDESSRWICMNNSDKKFADCSISQEMSNEEINAELGIGEDEADAYDCDAAKRGKDREKSKRLTGKQKACYKAIKTNQFLHRNRKSQTIDEIMICHCKPSADGRSGCGEECLNRMLNIECLNNTCPAGGSCSNQQFQKRIYAGLERFQSGKKGYGLRLVEDVTEGKFLIEYVGEVLDMQSYESRQKDYASKGQKHFYFMTLNGNEVIDAGAKGNLGRFINHSCEPNCRTEKWMVNGEICVGIFAMQDLKKGQELTFDYNYVRVFGAAAKKCHCGSSHCRGYIGGDPLNGDVVIQSDSDEEYPELVILEDDENVEGILDTTSRIFIDGADVQRPQSPEKVNGFKDLAPENAQSQRSVSLKFPDREILPPLPQPTEVLEELSSGVPVSAVQLEVPVEIKTKSTSPMSSSVSRLSSDGANADKMIKHGSGEDKKILPRPRPRTKTSRSSAGSSKRDKGGSLPGVSKAQIIIVNKLQQQPIKSKGSEEVSPSGRIETFEGKLNELLDAVGGISKRRDSAKGYLKLLLLTAASRGTNNEGIQSNRDLSMILDALLKTKSRTVLVDVINKNGLQMLHNIMKQYRRDFKKTPILRKLLKVLEYLATREILALEHIIRRPPHVGMESFKDSILTLTEHDDKQVHQIARNFRDRWIPKPFRKPWRIEREERSESMRSPINSRFRTSQEPRYEHESPRPAEPFASVIPSRAATPETASVSEGYSEPNSSLPETNRRKRKSRWDQPSMTKEQRIMSDGNQDVQDDLPPGFSSPCTAVPDAVTSQLQPKFLSRVPVTYGIPLSIVRQFGSPGKEDPTSWSVAPGIPFYPFPPPPPVSHGEFFAKRNGKIMDNSSCSNEILPATTATSQSCWNISSVDVCNSTRKRECSYDIGTSYFRQQKQNIPPWMRNDGLEKTANSPIPGNLTLEKKLSS